MYELNFEGQYAAIPQRMRESIERYCVNHIKPGDFLTAVLQNDLSNAVLKADPENLPLLKLYLLWFHNNTHGLWGPENFAKHLKKAA